MPVYVQHEILGKVNDVFNAESLWQAPGLALFSRRPLLRDLLERSPREHRGQAATRCFSHVTLLLAQEELDDDRHLTRGARARDLAQSLAALHQKDFGDLLGADDVRYDVIGTEALAPGEVQVKFGHAVYLPKPGESILYQVSTSRDGDTWHAACPIYLHQRLALLGQDKELASHAAPEWPFGADGAILLVNDGPDAAIEVQARPKGLFDCMFDPQQNCYAITRRGATGADGEPLRLLMKVTQVQPASVPAARKSAVWKARTHAPESEQTALPLSHRPSTAPAFETDATFAPVAQQSVTLVGLALPRLSRYRDTGAVGLHIAFDAALGLAGEGQASALDLRVDANDQLRANDAIVQAPVSLHPVAGATVELLAPPAAMADRYCATVLLPHPASMAVAAGARLQFGRAAPMLAALRILDSPRFLDTAPGFPRSSADRIGLSRSAFQFEAGDGSFQIVRSSSTQALFHLDASLQFVAELPDGPQPYRLPRGHHLVAGHYVLRFDA